MRAVSSALLVGATLVASTVAAPADAPLSSDASGEFVEVTPQEGNYKPYHNRTFNIDEARDPAAGAAQANPHLKIKLENNGAGKKLTAYILGTPVGSDCQVFIKANGQQYQVTSGTGKPIPSSDIGIDVGQGKTVTLPGLLESARVYMAEGNLKFIANTDKCTTGQPAPDNKDDPNANINYGFAEFTNNDAGLFANPSAVDVVGLPLAIASGKKSIPGFDKNGVNEVCADLKKANKKGAPWGSLCQSFQKKPIRAVAPHFFPDSYKNYWTAYVDKVYKHFASNTLTIQGNGATVVKCKTTGGVLNCDGGAGAFKKPTAVEIFGCASEPGSGGPFDPEAPQAALDVQPAFCAAFNRGTFLLKGGDSQPNGVAANLYYTTLPNNQYSKFVHKHEKNGQGYGFAYDDVAPKGKNFAGVIQVPSPDTFVVTAK